MPELPEVETSRRGIAPHILGKTFQQVTIRQPNLRWPVPDTIAGILPGLRLDQIDRRGKYLLLSTTAGSLLLHLGMSGNLRITTADQPVLKHDHVDFVFADQTILRFNDQRRFGAVLWTDSATEQHPLIAELGPEPLSEHFHADYLFNRCQNRRIPIKSLIMDSHVVVGVGNIYASESLFMAGILPTRPAEDVTLNECQRLTTAIKTVLQWAIDQGGTTLRDFVNAQGKPGYFQQSLSVYGRTGQSCLKCAEPIQHLKLAQRASYFCNHCQS
ncbi:MAG: DNA-formamidopyrimidine glycosylase [Methylomonas sp.]|nr:MAG: DNA-formamidopyrimidine glycosylase [Methylomonas sp.]